MFISFMGWIRKECLKLNKFQVSSPPGQSQLLNTHLICLYISIVFDAFFDSTKTNCFLFFLFINCLIRVLSISPHF